MPEFEYIVASVHLPGIEPLNWGVLLVDATSDRLHYRFRGDFGDQLIGPDDAAVIRALAEHFVIVAEQEGPAALLTALIESASNTIRVTDRKHIAARTAADALARAYEEHIG